MATVRRVVTGEADGKAVYAKIEEVEPIPGTTIYGVWGFDEPQHVPVNPTVAYRHTSIFPPSGGVRVNMIQFPPASTPPATMGESEKTAWDEIVTAIPAHRERTAQFVKTDSVDICFVISGEVVVELDDGAETTLRPGDVYVQNGARHHWSNRGAEPCIVGCVVLPAIRDGADPL
jgi:mannose-6-phosphate isomerase-like protein (cupin superfamily)